MSNPETPQTYIRFKGEFDYQKFYSTFQNFFLSREFDFYEEVYKDKGNDIRGKWRFEREYDEYHRVVFKTFYRVHDVKFKEVVLRGEKKTIISGRMYMYFKGILEMNYQKSPAIFDEKNKTDAFLKKVADTVRHREVEEYWEVLILVMLHDLMKELKECLGMTDT